MSWVLPPRNRWYFTPTNWHFFCFTIGDCRRCGFGPFVRLRFFSAEVGRLEINTIKTKGRGFGVPVWLERLVDANISEWHAKRGITYSASRII